MIYTIICIALLLLLELLFPAWLWILVIPGVLQILSVDPPRRAFFKGGCSGGLVWLVAASYLWSSSADIIASRISIMMHLPDPVWLLAITGSTAFIIAGCSALCGALLRYACAQPAS
jgi:uncharacterized membrane protein YdbT with pleckstrin-like domain